MYNSELNNGVNFDPLGIEETRWKGWQPPFSEVVEYCSCFPERLRSLDEWTLALGFCFGRF